MSTKEDSTAENGGQNPSNDQNQKDQNIYDQRTPTTKFIRIITVMAYLISVSFVAIVLSAYYIFLWQPPNSSLIEAQIGEPRVDYLMDSSMSPDKRKKLNGIIDKINLTRMKKNHNYRDNKIEKINATKTSKSLETSTGVYGFINEHKFGASFNFSNLGISTTPESVNNVSELSIANVSMIGEKYIDGNFTFGSDDDGIINGTDAEFPTESMEVFTETAENDEVTQQRITIKPNATEFMRRLESIYPPIYIDKDEENEATNELEASLEPMPSMSPTSTEEIEDFSEDTVDEPPDIEFDSENLPRR